MTAPTEHDQPAPTAVVERVRRRIDDLRQPCRTVTAQWVAQRDALHLVRREVTVELPPLLVQLAHSVAGSTSGHRAPGSKARPPGSLEGTDLLRTITQEALYLAGRILARYAAAALPGLQLTVRPRRLADALNVIWEYAAQIDRDSLLDIDAAVRRWWATARVVTTWDTAPLKPYVPCPACRKRGGLQVIDRPLVMVCLDCGSAWDGATAADLEVVYRLAFADTPAEIDALALHEQTPPT